jgi:hypothetical protein
MRLQKKSLSRVQLTDLLRRRKTTLEKFLKDTGIVTYELLVERCSSMGVVAPTREQFSSVRGNPETYEVSSPTEGVVVLSPPEKITVISEASGAQIDISDTREEIIDYSQTTITPLPLDQGFLKPSGKKKKKFK